MQYRLYAGDPPKPFRDVRGFVALFACDRLRALPESLDLVALLPKRFLLRKFENSQPRHSSLSLSTSTRLTHFSPPFQAFVQCSFCPEPCDFDVSFIAISTITEPFGLA